jgi:hypothetical protein
VETSTEAMLSLVAVHDLAVIVVSTNEAHWLQPCLRTVFDHAGSIDLDVIVADNESRDARAGRARVRTGARRHLRKPRFLACEQSSAYDV